MRNFTIMVPANRSKRFNVAGSRILLCDASSLPEFIVSVDGGEAIPFKEGRKYTHGGGTYSLVEVVNPDNVNALTVSLIVGAGDMSDNSVYVQSIQSIVQTVNTDDAGTQAAIAAAQAGIEALLSGDMNARRPYGVLGSNNAGSTNTTTPTVLLAPASNVNGAIVRAAAALSGTSNEIEIVAKSSAPSGSKDFSAMLIAACISGGSFCAPLPLLVPAGLGIYSVGGTTGASQYTRISYDLL